MKCENSASLAQSLQEINSEGQYLHVQAETEVGTLQAKRPTTHSTTGQKSIAVRYAASLFSTRLPYLYSPIRSINHRHLFSARFFKWGQKQLSSQLCILQKLFLFGHTTAFSRTFFCLRFSLLPTPFRCGAFSLFSPLFCPFS